MTKTFKIFLFVLLLLSLHGLRTYAAGAPKHGEPRGELNVKEFILEHVSDNYVWHITTIGELDLYVPLPIILYSQHSGWHVFMSSVFHHTEQHKGFILAHEGEFKGKIVERNATGEMVRPFDISITKNAFSLIFNSILLIIIIMSVARSYKRNPMESKSGFIGMMEMIIVNIYDDLIKPCVGKDYKKFAPYLLTLFFFIFINNLVGLVPIFPGGANVTGNITVTMGLAVITFLITNFSGSKEYWREILWPDVPLWLKVPLPVMPLIEIAGIFTKPFALMIRLFANILAGHSIVLGLTSLVFVTVKLGPAMNAGMTTLSVAFSVFILVVELLVSYIQAYIFTMLTAVFIGLARIEPHHPKEKIKSNINQEMETNRVH
jgi:F-type H+-transporting ATPase subunit a